MRIICYQVRKRREKHILNFVRRRRRRRRRRRCTRCNKTNSECREEEGARMNDDAWSGERARSLHT